MEAVGFNIPKEKLLCLMALDDEVGATLTEKPGDGFWRAFIVEDRLTREIRCNFRYRYKDGDSWYHVVPKKQDRQAALDYLQSTMIFMLTEAMRLMFKITPDSDMVKSYINPDPDSDPDTTLAWLLKEDLVYVSSVEIKDADENV
jgi:hypothetical protein